MIGKHLKKVIGMNNKMDLIKCNQCGKLIAHIRFPWDDCGGQDFYCLECKPITEEEQEHLDYAKFIAKRRKSQLSTKDVLKN